MSKLMGERRARVLDLIEEVCDMTGENGRPLTDRMLDIFTRQRNVDGIERMIERLELEVEALKYENGGFYENG